MLKNVMVLLSLVSVCAYANAGIDARQNRQEKRIEQGVNSGELNAREAKNLERGQERIEKKEARFEATKADAMADGHIDGKEARKMHRQKANIRRSQNHQSRKIHRKKHNNR